MALTRILVVLSILHIGMAIVQVNVNYFAMDRAGYGAGGIIANTPLEQLIPLDTARDLSDEATPNPNALDRLLDPPRRVGAMINGLASFEYGVLDMLGDDSSLTFGLALAFRIGSAFVWLVLALRLLYVLFDSGVLNSGAGIALVGLGVVGVAGASLLDLITGV